MSRTGAVFARPYGAISLNAVVTTANGSPIPGRLGSKATVTVVTGAGVDTGTATLQASHDSSFPGTPTEVDTFDLAAIGASETVSRHYAEAYPFWRLITSSGPHNGPVSGYIQFYRS